MLYPIELRTHPSRRSKKNYLDGDIAGVIESTSQYRNRFPPGRLQMILEDAGGSSQCGPGSDHLLRCDDEIDGEIVYGDGDDPVVEDLGGMNRRRNRRAVVDQAGFGSDGKLQIGVATAFAQTSSSPVDSDRAA